MWEFVASKREKDFRAIAGLDGISINDHGGRVLGQQLELNSIVFDRNLRDVDMFADVELSRLLRETEACQHALLLDGLSVDDFRFDDCLLRIGNVSVNARNAYDEDGARLSDAAVIELKCADADFAGLVLRLGVAGELLFRP